MHMKVDIDAADAHTSSVSSGNVGLESTESWDKPASGVYDGQKECEVHKALDRGECLVCAGRCMDKLFERVAA